MWKKFLKIAEVIGFYLAILFFLGVIIMMWSHNGNMGIFGKALTSLVIAAILAASIHHRITNKKAELKE